MKDDDCEEGDCDARYDEVDRVKQRLAADRHVEGDVWLRLRTTIVALHVLSRRHAQYVPLNTPVELFQINAVIDHVMRNDVPDPLLTLLVINVGQVDL